MNDDVVIMTHIFTHERGPHTTITLAVQLIASSPHDMIPGVTHHITTYKQPTICRLIHAKPMTYSINFAGTMDIDIIQGYTTQQTKEDTTDTYVHIKCMEKQNIQRRTAAMITLNITYTSQIHFHSMSLHILNNFSNNGLFF